MRDFKGMKRQRGRNRGGGGGGKPQHNANRAFESNGPDGVKVRGAAQSIFERYQQLARDATSAGDRVLAENYLQHAEHYFRTLRAMQPHRPLTEILGRDQVSSGFDIDFEAEPGEAPAEENTESSEDGGEGANNSNSNDGGDQQRQGDRQQRDRYENRDRDRNRDGGDRQRDDRQRDDRQRDGERQQQGEGRDFNRSRNRDRWRDRDDRPRGDQSREQSETPAQPPAAAEAPKDGPVLRSEDGEVSHAPAFLGRAAEPRPEAAEGAAPRRRRRAPKSGEGAAAAETEEV